MDSVRRALILSSIAAIAAPGAAVVLTYGRLLKGRSQRKEHVGDIWINPTTGLVYMYMGKGQ